MFPNKTIRSIILILLLLLTTGCIQELEIDRPPIALNGVLDLKDWDFQSDGYVELNGEWKLYWNRILDYQTLTDNPPPDDGLFYIPAYWTGHTIGKKSIPGHGYATFSLQIKLPEHTPKLAIRILEQQSAYSLFVQGQRILSNGRVGINRDSMEPDSLPVMATFQPAGDRLDLVLQVSNFNHRNGGPWTAIQMGTPDSIRQIRNTNLYSELFVIGSLFIISLYHFGLFVLRRKDRSSFYFALMCFLIVVRSLSTNERFLLELLPSLPWDHLIRIEYLTFYLIVPLFLHFIHSLFPEEVSKKLSQFSAVVCFVFVIIVLVTSTNLFSYSMPVFQSLTLLAGFYLTYVLLLAIKRKQAGSLILTAGFVLFFLAFINDALYSNGFIHTGYYGSAGLFVLVFSQAFMLSLRFSQAFYKIESLSTDLKATASELKRKNLALEQSEREKAKYAQELEIKVDERTQQLNSALEQITEQSHDQKELLHILCHDLANPLQSLSTLLELLEPDPEQDTEELLKLMAISLNNGLSMIEMVRQLRSVEEHARLDVKPCNLKRMVDNSKTIMRQQFQNKDIELVLEIDPRFEVLVEETSFVNSVLSNLFSNAIKFSFPGSSIYVKAQRQEDNCIELSVRDKGIGMAPDIMKDLFDFGVNSSRRGTRGERGSGFGVPMIHRFVTAYQGSLRIKSIPKTESSNDHGTVITLILRGVSSDGTTFE